MKQWILALVLIVAGAIAQPGCNSESTPPAMVTNMGGMATPVCGDGTVDAAEECDDNNMTDNDGCSSTCKFEVSGDYFVSLVTTAQNDCSLNNVNMSFRAVQTGTATQLLFNLFQGAGTCSRTGMAPIANRMWSLTDDKYPAGSCPDDFIFDWNLTFPAAGGGVTGTLTIRRPGSGGLGCRPTACTSVYDVTNGVNAALQCTP